MQPLWKTVWRLPKKSRIELTYDPAILLLGIYLKKKILKDARIPTFIVVLFIIAKMWK